MVPPPVGKDNFDIEKETVNKNFTRVIQEIAQNMNMPKSSIIDIFNALGGPSFSKKNLFCDKTCCDGVHPVDAGYQEMAKTIYKAIFERN